jgi:GIY-YIG catalytic domain
VPLSAAEQPYWSGLTRLIYNLGDTMTVIRDANSFPAFILMNNSELQIQARKILDTIAFMPFEQGQPLTRGFESIPARPGIYAVRHRTHELLYIGKTKSLRGRFSGGHKAFL